MNSQLHLEANGHFDRLFHRNQESMEKNYELFVIVLLAMYANIQVYIGKENNMPKEVNQEKKELFKIW